MDDSKPIAVITADVHYDLNTLSLAEAAMRLAIDKANALTVPLIVAGDLHNTKALLRGECVKAIIETFKLCDLEPIVIVGNHCRLNEKNPEHSLHFLEEYAQVVDYPVFDGELDSWLIPYYSNAQELRDTLGYIKPGARLIMHQGLLNANMGHYIQDKSALSKEDVADFRVISGHYHCRQDIKCGRPRAGAVGLFSYVGNPYTLTFSEAKDPPKGFQILYDNGLLEFVPTNLRRHLAMEIDSQDLGLYIKSGPPHVLAEDLVWIKITGPQSELDRINKTELGLKLLGHSNYKLDKIPLQCEEKVKRIETLTNDEIMDAVVDNTGETEEQKAALKKLWRELVS